MPLTAKQAETMAKQTKTAEDAVYRIGITARRVSDLGDGVDPVALKRQALDLERAGCALRRMAAKLEAEQV